VSGSGPLPLDGPHDVVRRPRPILVMMRKSGVPRRRYTSRRAEGYLRLPSWLGSAVMESYAAGETTPALIEETIGANLERIAAEHAEREALVEMATGRRWTYAELDRDVDRVARGLMAADVAKGDRVGIWSPNCAEWTLVQYATAKIGAVLVNINPAYRTHELSYVLNQSGVRLLVSATEFKTSDYRAMVGEVREDATALERVVFLGTDDWDALLAEGAGLGADALPRRMATCSNTDPINIQYTSGTTGFPKGATLSHRNILNNGFFTTELINFTSADRLAIPVPFYHCFGMVMGNLGCTTHGAAMVIPAPGFDPALTLQAVQDERCTGVYGVPTMFIAMQNHPDFDSYDLSSLRTGVMAGSICPVEVMKRCVDDMHMAEVSIAYGMTETSPVSCQTRSDDDLDRRTASIGRVHPHVEVKIVDPVTGATVERGAPGEFCTRGYSVMIGYWDDPEKTDEAVDADGWMHTGDLAVMREDGYCNIVGRIKDMVIRGGENIYPREIEEFLYTHPDIEDVQVIGVPDEKYGEELCAWVKLRNGADSLDADGVRAVATGKLAHYKIPRYVLVVDDFPMTVTGKIRKVQMREETAEKLGL
jgi:fatty-acyl-CoA synthase